MKNKELVIKGLFGFFGCIFIVLGLVNLMAIFLILKEYNFQNVLKEDPYSQFLLVINFSFYFYVVFIGAGIFREKKWIEKGSIALPFMYLLVEFATHPNQRTQASFILWLLSLCFAAFIFNSRIIKAYLKSNIIEEKQKENTLIIFLRCYFWILLFLSLISTYISFSFNVREFTQTFFTYVSFIAFFGFVYHRRILSNIFWKFFLIFYFFWEAACYIFITKTLFGDIAVFTLLFPKYWIIIKYAWIIDNTSVGSRGCT